MSKIYLEVFLPGNGKIYEFQVDENMNIGNVKQKIIDEIMEFESKYISFYTYKMMLFNESTQELLSETVSLKSFNVRSGQTLILV